MDNVLEETHAVSAMSKHMETEVITAILRQMLFSTCRGGGKASKKSKKGVAKRSVTLLKETIQVGCVS